MSEEKQESSLDIARRKLASVLEIYAPLSVGREQTLQALSATLVEFEAAVREDERGVVALAALTALDAAQLEAKNATPPAPVVVDPPPPSVALVAGELAAPTIEVSAESKVVTEPKKKKGRSE